MAWLLMMSGAFWLGVWWAELPDAWTLIPAQALHEVVLEIEALPTIAVFDTDANARVQWPLEAYVAGVVAGEMPAAYQAEALKAQAVAARTRAIAGHCASHPEAAVCTSSLCCQAYLSETEQRARWGTEYEVYAQKVRSAAEDTAGRILTYEGKPILVLYHAVSGGHTEDVEQVYGQSLPYLRGVASDGEEHASRYETVQSFTREGFAKQVNDALPEAALLAATLEKQVAIEARSSSGRVIGLRLGSVYSDGRALRKILGLYSAWFELDFQEKQVVVTQRGYGHGVGMSQAGAEAMARTGADFTEILCHYYTGIDIVYMDDLGSLDA